MVKPGRIGSKVWVPAGVLIATGAVLAGTLIASAAAPALPKRTAAQLLADAAHATLPRAMSAVVVESANLGFPALPNIAGLSSSTLSAASLITGTHTVDIWYAGPQHVRIALPVSFGETDLRINGRQVWLWDSKSQTATRYLAPAVARVTKPQPATAPPVPAVTPLQAAKMALAEVGPTTKVTVAGTGVVAGRSAYQLTIAPRSDQSLIDRVVISIDAVTHLPLQVQIFARGMSGPAFQIGFTSLVLSRPAMSNFAFTPPHGAKVKTVRLAGLLPGLPGLLSGHVGWTGSAGPLPGGVLRPIVVRRGVHLSGGLRVHIVKLNGVVRRIVLPRGFTKVQVAKLRAKGFRIVRVHGILQAIITPRALRLRHVPLPVLQSGPLASAGPKLLGSGWLTVAVFPNAGPLVAFAGASGGPGARSVTKAPSSAPSAHSSSLQIAVPSAAGGELALLRVLLRAATPVHGSWGSGRLLRTSLFSVLLTSKGQVLVGAVTPAVLYADAAKAK